MIVGVVDIGTNSMRLLVVDDGRERLKPGRGHGVWLWR